MPTAIAVPREAKGIQGEAMSPATPITSTAMLEGRMLHHRAAKRLVEPAR
jgi:hypothetical protein